MKKFYEAPIVEELYANAENLMADATQSLVGGGDNSGGDLVWDSDLLA